MAGDGKSQLATEYAYQHQGDYDLVWWIPTEQAVLIDQAVFDPRPGRTPRARPGSV
jgi:hypothetical protein